MILAATQVTIFVV